MTKNKDFTFEIVEKLGVLSVHDENGWAVEVNRVAWNGNEPKYDIRAWSPDHTKMGKGVTMTLSEFEKLKELMKDR